MHAVKRKNDFKRKNVKNVDELLLTSDEVHYVTTRRYTSHLVTYDVKCTLCKEKTILSEKSNKKVSKAKSTVIYVGTGPLRHNLEVHVTFDPL